MQPPAHSPVVELLADLEAALTGAKVRWYLFGAQAALLYGAARLTADVDVTVQLPGTMSSADLVHHLDRHRFYGRIDDPAFIEHTRVIPFVHAPTALPLDIILAGPGLEDQFFERIVTREIDDVRVWVASPEDVVIMKVLAGRPKDLDDVAAIVAAQAGGLDAEYVRTTLAQLEGALAQSDLLPAFEQARTRAQEGS